MDKKTLIGELSRIVSRTTNGDHRTIAEAYITDIESDSYKVSQILEFINQAQLDLV